MNTRFRKLIIEKLPGKRPNQRLLRTQTSFFEPTTAHLPVHREVYLSSARLPLLQAKRS